VSAVSAFPLSPSLVREYRQTAAHFSFLTTIVRQAPPVNSGFVRSVLHRPSPSVVSRPRLGPSLAFPVGLRLHLPRLLQTARTTSPTTCTRKMRQWQTDRRDYPPAYPTVRQWRDFPGFRPWHPPRARRRDSGGHVRRDFIHLPTLLPHFTHEGRTACLPLYPQTLRYPRVSPFAQVPST
jgi:hypothetical protein